MNVEFKDKRGREWETFIDWSVKPRGSARGYKRLI